MTKKISAILIFFIFITLVSKAQNDIPDSFIIKFKNPAFIPNFINLFYNNKNVSIRQNLRNQLLFFKKNNKEKILTAEQNADYYELEKYLSIQIDNKINSDSLVNEIRKSPDIELVEPNYIYHIDSPADMIPNDPMYQEQWSLKAVNAEKAWEKASGKGIIVGVIDTGIDFDHPDLKHQLWINSGEDINHNGKFDPWPITETRNGVTGDLDGIDNDNNGVVDDVIGYDFVDQSFGNIGDYSEPDPIPYDENGHGTTVAGVIAAERNNNIGISGLAFNARILTVRVLDATGNGESDNIANGIVYAALQGAKILNFSFGEAFNSSIMHDAIKFAYSLGCVMTASSGNNNWPLPHYPSGYDECISVGATIENNTRYSISNYGSRLTLVAPGRDIMTTVPHGGYKSMGGTSYSAPHAAAVSAMLFELDSTLTPADVSGILQASATDLGEPGWDIYYGAGLLNAEKAVNTIGKTNLSITFPKHEAVFNKDSLSAITVIGSVVTPLFDNFRVYIGKGLIPNDWQYVSDISSVQKINDTLAKFNIENLPDSTYTIRILVNLKNGGTIENRTNIDIVSSGSPIVLKYFKTLTAWSGNKRIVLVTAVTNYNSRFSVKFHPAFSSDNYKELTETDRYSTDHTIVIGNECQPDVEMEAIATAVRGDGSTVQQSFRFTRSGEIMPESMFSAKSYYLPLSYLSNHVAGIYSKDNPTIVVNDLSGGTWGKTKTYEFKNSQFQLRDSINDVWLPRGIGYTNDDSIPDVLTTSNGMTVLFGAKSEGKSPFSNVLFSDTLSENLWAAGLYDIDGDGKDEIISYSDSGFVAFKYIDGQYKAIALATPPAGYDIIPPVPGYAFGDFDGDGKVELCHSNWNGNVFIYEYSNNRFNLEFSDTNNVSYGEQYICSADVDGDGIPEILIGDFGTTIPYGSNNDGVPIWYFRLLKSTGPNKYDYVWKDYFYGVRIGSDYKEGVAAGNLDNKPGDEIIISAFPNLYVFQWNKNNMEPLWWYPYSFSNDAIVYDFDKNGVNELGFSTFSNTRFVEFNTGYNAPSIPIGFDGWALDGSSAYFHWNATTDSKSYQVLKLITDSTADLAAETSITSCTVTGLDNEHYYTFAVRAVNDSLRDSVGSISDSVEIYTHSPIKPVEVQVVGQNIVNIKFSGRLSDKSIEPSLFIVSDTSGTFIAAPLSSISSNDTMLTLNFNHELPAGKLKINISSFPDYYNTPTISSQIIFSVYPDTLKQELYLANLNVISTDSLILNFSEPVTPNSAVIPGNYILKPYGKIKDIVMESVNDLTAVISLDPSQSIGPRGVTYTLTAVNIIAQSGRQMTRGPGNTLAFRFSADDNNSAYLYPNPIRLSILNSVYVANLTRNANVYILTLNGQLLRTLMETNANGGVEWDCRDNNGNLLKPGIYLFKVKSTDSNGNILESGLKKFMVLP